MPHQKDRKSETLLKHISVRLETDDGIAIASMKCPLCEVILVECRVTWMSGLLSGGSLNSAKLAASTYQLLIDNFGHLEHVCHGE